MVWIFSLERMSLCGIFEMNFPSGFWVTFGIKEVWFNQRFWWKRLETFFYFLYTVQQGFLFSNIDKFDVHKNNTAIQFTLSWQKFPLLMTDECLPCPHVVVDPLKSDISSLFPEFFAHLLDRCELSEIEWGFSSQVKAW